MTITVWGCGAVSLDGCVAGWMCGCVAVGMRGCGAVGLDGWRTLSAYYRNFGDWGVVITLVLGLKAEGF